MFIPFSPRHFQHPGTLAVSTPSPGDQWRAFMLRSTEARCEWAVESGGLYPPSRSSCVLMLTQMLSRPPRLHVNRREQNHRTPPGFPCDPGTDPQHCLWMSVRVTASGPGATLTLSFLTPRLQRPPPFTTHFLRSLSLRLDRSPRRSSPLRLFDHTFPGTFSLERRPRVSLLPWPETPLDKRWPSARGTRTARGAPTRAPPQLSPRSALPTCREPGVPTPPTASWNPPAASTRLALPPPAGRAPDWWKRESLCPPPRAAPPQGGLRLLLLALPPPAHRRAASAQKFWTKSWELAARSPRRERGRLRVPSARRPVRGAGSRRSAGSRAALLRLVRELSARRCGGTGEAGFASSSVWGRTS